MGRGRKSKPFVGCVQSRCKYVCKAEGCGAEILSYELEKHYLRKCNRDLLARLKNYSEVEREQALSTADPHTKFLFLNGFSAENLPAYR
jgi:hypothetical protein